MGFIWLLSFFFFLGGGGGGGVRVLGPIALIPIFVCSIQCILQFLLWLDAGLQVVGYMVLGFLLSDRCWPSSKAGFVVQAVASLSPFSLRPWWCFACLFLLFGGVW